MGYKIKTVDELEFSDDYMFCAIMNDDEICKEDPFSANLPVYRFKNICTQDPELILNDKTTKLFYNTSRFDDVKDQKLNSFLKFVYSNTPSDDFTASLENKISEMKIDEIFRSTYMIMSLHEQTVHLRGKEEGLKEGIEKLKETNQ